MDEVTRFKLVQAATTYDQKQAGKRGYNPYALGQYFQAIDNAAEMMTDDGIDLRSAIIRSFCGRLCDCLLRSVGCQIMTDSECKTGVPA